VVPTFVLARFKNQFLLDPFILNSVPKAGTHLLCRAVELFPGVAPGIAIRKAMEALAERFTGADSVMVPLAIGVETAVPFQCARDALAQLRRGKHGYGHFHYSDELAGLLSAMGIKTVLILRDPRDVVVSHASHIFRGVRNRLHKHFQSLSEPERLMSCIRGCVADGYQFRSVDERFRAVLPWVSQPFNYTTYFEKLVGAKGGGSHETQMQELRNIAHHLGLGCSDNDLAQIPDKLFGKSATFRKGTIGSWRDTFEEHHRAAFKEVAGKLLIDLGYEQDLEW
jgi:hypothetical protein